MPDLSSAVFGTLFFSPLSSRQLAVILCRRPPEVTSGLDLCATTRYIMPTRWPTIPALDPGLVLPPILPKFS